MERKKVEFRFLSEADMMKAGVLDVAHCVEVMDDTFKLLGTGDFVMGGYNQSSHGCMLWYPKQSPFPNMPLAGPDRRYMAMPAYIGGRYNCCGVKWYGSNVSNPKERGLPRSILLVGLNDPVTGEPLAIMSANLLSAMRTGSVPGVATKYLARKDAQSLGVIGCGVISRACARGILVNMPQAKRLYLYDIREESAKAFAEELAPEFPGLEMVICSDLKESVVDSDVISVAAAGPVPVVIDEAWLKPGCLFTATGHAEISDQCWQNNRVVFDYWPMHSVWYEEGRMHPDGIESTRDWAPSYQIFKLLQAGAVKEEDMISLSDVAVGKVAPRVSDEEKILFISGGLPVEDVSWGYTLYEEALKQGLGQELKLWDQAHWL
ncbi:tyramine oxidase subunit B [Flavonifractor sp. An100]|uniref:tyramine oxidase subunit B n=1 Tax=Flavonifractor sp. An100 TaxID=1965538 RepID=UPI000B36C40B|nr:tyramine oxidase subunit B [Flavonifractor sp. An100]OUQ77057.1 ornithine cyclodeaminase [Flavonifractor sp. An100]